MRIKQLTAIVAAALCASSYVAQANNDASHNWMPSQPTNNYWQAPNWSGFNMPPVRNNYQRPVPQQNYNRPPSNYQAPNTNRTAPPPPAGPYSGGNMPNQHRAAPGPRGPYNPGPYNRAPYNNRGQYNGPSAFHTPGYNPNRNYRGNNGWDNNKFWGRSGPSTWMNPNKQNWENGWDDMINAPSRMGDMPGGWSAPEVTMPNPVDMADQFQDNVQDLPEQMRDGNIGNNVSN